MRAVSLLAIGLLTCLPPGVLAGPLILKDALPSKPSSKHLRPSHTKRGTPGFSQGEPYDGNGKGSVFSGEFKPDPE